MHDLYSTDFFEAKYTYTGDDLGAVWTPEKTVFRLWAPTAQAVTVRLYASGTPGCNDLLTTLKMHRDVCGTWIAERCGNLNGIYYTYQVTVDGHSAQCCDPYARTTGVNGQRAMILDLASTDPPGWENDRDPNAGRAVTDAVIYELHIRDLSMHPDSGIRNKGKFLGVIETGTKTRSGIPTGLDHIKSLGITHLHLLPVYDYGSVDESCPDDNRFNWGYDPVNFNVPEGSYSTDPYNGAVRVREMKQMVKGLHDGGISVVMDVVYNHVFETDKFCFNRIVPGYFSRFDADGVFSNGSGCGNDTASERSMVRKYIVDSVKYWADEYHIDGFRFDLVGLIDTQTIREVMAQVHASHPNVIFYGEGWNMPTAVTKPGCAMTTQANSALVPGFAFFSDTIRDALRGSTFQTGEPGYVSGAVGDRDTLQACFMGIPFWAQDPTQCVNYVSCHDNNTLIDRIALASPNASREQQIRMNHLAAAYCLCAQGIPFLQAGEELLRSKPDGNGGFVENSYRSPDRVNCIRWSNLDQAEYRTSLEYYKGLIALRKAHPALRMTSREEVISRIHPIPCENPHVIAFYIQGKADELIFVIFNADTHPVEIPLPMGKWDVYVQDTKAGCQVLQTISGTARVAPISAMFLVQKPVDVVASLIWQEGKFLICQRPAKKARGLLWEFAGGKVEPGETLQQALIRECQEELAVTPEVGQQFMQVVHEYPDILIRLTLFHCRIADGCPTALEHNDLKWITPGEIPNYPFCPADKDILARIIETCNTIS